MSEPKRPAAALDSVAHERMDAVSELVKRVSHDYNNLFGIVIAALGILQDDIDEHPEIAQLKPLISDALSASREGTELMEKLLACTGYHLLQPEAVDVGHMLEDLRSRIQPLMPDGIDLTLDVEPGLPGAYADAAAMQSALGALAENAREAMPSGGVLRISARRCVPEDAKAAGGEALEPGDYIAVAVTDTGDGIEPALLGRVLEPFFTTREPAKDRGFGLSRSYGFARQSQGRLLLESAPARGTTVTLLIPVAKDRSA